MALGEEAFAAAADVEAPPDFFGVVLRLDAYGEHHHVHRHVPYPAEEGVLGVDDQVAVFLGDLGHPPPHELGALFLDTVVKLLVALPRGTHVYVELGDVGPRALPDQVGQLERVHATDAGTVGVGVGVTGTDAMHDRHPPGPCPRPA